MAYYQNIPVTPVMGATQSTLPVQPVVQPQPQPVGVPYGQPLGGATPYAGYGSYPQGYVNSAGYLASSDGYGYGPGYGGAARYGGAYGARYGAGYGTGYGTSYAVPQYGNMGIIVVDIMDTTTIIVTMGIY
ncbi:hypothetical protein D9758_003531 [Tetrapyrgos nigripes]|uniref:Uncharacterized protein n=1 Tax=Tetrapyrgos nigripes TaxID=182062 RepID=A0A8H5GV86_9AGAR|nr:hypothetical protein D9758_003531 [Tetrapyrgos nigripes]